MITAVKCILIFNNKKPGPDLPPPDTIRVNDHYLKSTHDKKILYLAICAGTVRNKRDVATSVRRKRQATETDEEIDLRTYGSVLR